MDTQRKLLLTCRADLNDRLIGAVEAALRRLWSGMSVPLDKPPYCNLDGQTPFKRVNASPKLEHLTLSAIRTLEDVVRLGCSKRFRGELTRQRKRMTA